MKLCSARQAWHDAFYSPEVSRTIAAQEQAKLGVKVQYSSKLNTARVAADHALSGVVQNAIALLPVPLQLVGHWLYAPYGAFPNYRENVWHMVAAKAGLHPERDKELWLLADAAIHAYREYAVGRPHEVSMCNYPFRIRRWIEAEHSVSINSRRWTKHYQLTWSALWRVLDDLDRKALQPVASAITEATADLDDRDYVQWGNQLVNFKRVMNHE